MYSNPSILTINKSKYISLFKEFLLTKQSSFNVNNSISLWVSESVTRYMQNAFLPSGQQFRYLNNIGSGQFNEVLLLDDHDDITAKLFLTLKQSGLVITSDYYTQVMIFLDLLKKEVMHVIKGKSVYTQMDCLFDTEYQITFKETFNPAASEKVQGESRVPTEVLNNPELLNHYLGTMDLDSFANQVELLNERLNCGY